MRPLRWLFLLVCFLAGDALVAAPIKVIFDTDVGDDCDDAGALAMLHALADRGEIEILAVMVSNRAPNAVACADAINTWFGRPDLPLGRVTNPRSTQTNDRYATAIVQRFPHSIARLEDVPSATTLYRRVLAAQPDRSVVIVVVGPPTNISDLLHSRADEFSSLDGATLLARKVVFYSAGGNGRSGLPRGEAGWNYQWDLEAARHELAALPESIPFVFAGGSGMKIQTGAGYAQKPENHIIRACYMQFHGRATNLSRNSWDQLRLWYAVRERSNFDTAPFGDIVLQGKVLVYSAQPQRNRTYAYVKDHARAAAEIETLMMHEPASRAAGAGR